MLNGVGASKGIAIGEIFVYKKKQISFEQASKITDIEEKNRLKDALIIFTSDTTRLAENIAENVGKEEAAILEGHILMATDPEIINAIEQNIQSDKVTAEYAVENVFDMFKNLFESMDDELMSQRASDLGDIKNRLLEILTGTVSFSLQDLKTECILVTKDLTPSDTAQMNKAMVLGIITEVGGISSHTAIISRAMELPAVLGVENATSIFKDKDFVIIDGSKGEIITNPTENEIKNAVKIQKDIEEEKRILSVYKDKETLTKDGVKVELFANIGGLSDLDSVLNNGAEGIGLFRTEFLYMDSPRLPSEEEQFQVYKKVAVALNGKPVIIRTLDVGGDKDIPYLQLEKEDNPFLGYRAIRICLENDNIFRPQIKALLRASAFGDIKIMFPMISSVDEIRKAKAFVETVKKELDEENISYNKNIELGIMIEIPAASIISDLLATECDFFSIGTNDLTQYTMAVDRGNKKVAYLYSTYNPALLRSITNIIKNAKNAGIMVGMCGEAASDPLMIPFLLAAGLDEFSMTASSVLSSRKLISTYSSSELATKLEEILKIKTEPEARKYLESLI